LSSNDDPKISVVIISYNFEKYLKECIDSILAQTLQPYELIICDDHSSDGSWAIIESYASRYPHLIKAYRHEKNMGVFYNGTFGGKVWTGEWVCLMDGDDRWLPQKLELEWKSLQQYPEARVAYSNVYKIDEQGRRIEIWYDGKGIKPPSGDVLIEVYSFLMFKGRNVYRNQLIHRDAFEKEGHCDEKLKSYWDWDRDIRLAARYKSAYSGMPLVEYRIHGGGTSAGGSSTHLTGLIQVYEKNLSLLNGRTAVEKAIVAISNEFHIGTMLLINNMIDRFNYYSIENVYRRCRPLIHRLHRDGPIKIFAQLTLLIARHFRQASRHEYAKGNLKLFLKYLMQSIRFKVITVKSNLENERDYSTHW